MPRQALLAAALCAFCFGSAASASRLSAALPSAAPAPSAAPFPYWLPASPGYHFAFPKDFGAHERARNEWWYYTGNVRDARGHRFGFEETIFRFGIQPPLPRGSAWDIDDLYFAHVALTDADGKRFFYADRTGRAALNAAGATAGDERAWVGDWHVERRKSGVHVLSAAIQSSAFHLQLTPAIGPTINGRNGVSRKGGCSTCMSHYYSFVRMRVTGSLHVGGLQYDVMGSAWNDHEWGSDEREKDLAGWDWFSIQLDDGTEVMLYRLRRTDGSTVPQSSGTLVAPNGASRYVPASDFSVAATGTWTSPHDGATYPSGWGIVLPRARMQLSVSPLLDDQELLTGSSTQVAYWEGACAIRGTHAGKPVHGYGYTELTGYARGGLGAGR